MAGHSKAEPAADHRRFRKVIYVSIMQLTERVARDWYVDHLVDQGIPVEFWDVREVFFGPQEEEGAISRPYLRRIRDIRELARRLRADAMKDAAYVMLISYTGNFTRVYRLLSGLGRNMMMINWGVLPTNPAPAWRKLLMRWSSPGWLLRTAYFIGKSTAFRRLGLVNPFDVLFAAGRVAIASRGDARRVVPINSVDYDHYVRVAQEPEQIVADPFAVFLDINLPFQSDLALSGLRAIDPENYFRSMNQFFGRLEAAWGVPIVIAAHPKSSYRSERFEGRRTVHGVTAELVRDAAFVISHTSTAMSYAVLNLKPLLFVYTRDMQLAYKDNLMQEMANYARYLDALMLNADATEPILSLAPVDRNRYERYKYDFLTSPESEHTTTRDIFMREICAG